MTGTYIIELEDNSPKGSNLNKFFQCRKSCLKHYRIRFTCVKKIPIHILYLHKPAVCRYEYFPYHFPATDKIASATNRAQTVPPSSVKSKYTPFTPGLQEILENSSKKFRHHLDFSGQYCYTDSRKNFAATGGTYAVQRLEWLSACGFHV